MSDLFDPNAIPEAPTLPTVTPVVSTPKKRKSYYVPVAQRVKEKNAAKRAAKEVKKAELAVREGKTAPVPNAKKRAAVAKALRSISGKGTVITSSAFKTVPKAKVVDVSNNLAVKMTKAKAKPEPEKSGSSGEAICSLCHKPLSRHTSVAAGMGDVCQNKIKLLPAGTTMEDHYEKLTVWEVPDGYIKLSEAVKKLKEKGISVYRIVQAIGGDRMLRKPLNSNFKVVFVNHVRYINGACLKNWKDLEKV